MWGIILCFIFTDTSNIKTIFCKCVAINHSTFGINLKTHVAIYESFTIFSLVYWYISSYLFWFFACFFPLKNYLHSLSKMRPQGLVGSWKAFSKWKWDFIMTLKMLEILELDERLSQAISKYLCCWVVIVVVVVAEDKWMGFYLKQSRWMPPSQILCKWRVKYFLFN